MIKTTKAHHICFVMSSAKSPLTRVEILKRVHKLENSQIAFRPTSNGCYFLPLHSEARTPFPENRTYMLGGEPYVHINGYDGEYASSLLVKGLIKKVGNVRHTNEPYTYVLTPAGEELARVYKSSFKR